VQAGKCYLPLHLILVTSLRSPENSECNNVSSGRAHSLRSGRACSGLRFARCRNTARLRPLHIPHAITHTLCLSRVRRKLRNILCFIGVSYRFLLSSYRFCCSSYRFRNSSYRFLLSSYRFCCSSYRFRCSSYRFRGSSYRFRCSSYRFRDSSYRFTVPHG